MSSEKIEQGRRKFLGAAGAAAMGAAAIPLSGGREAHAAKSKKLKIAMVGTGSRGTGLWGRTLNKNYSDVLEFVGLCDINYKRVEFAKKDIGVDCPTFTDFDEMIAKTKPDKVIVTTKDCFHAKYICRAMELGCDVITEKPMTTDEKMCQEVLDTERRTGQNVRVTFNYRYGPAAVRIKEIIASGEIGEITSVDFNYYLNTDHGASYFRRWHGYKQNSGSLLVHKSTHHFDLLNWWLDAEPMEVRAFADLRHYGFNGEFRAKNCRTCPHTSKCPYYWDITKSEHMMNLYVNCEDVDGYIRDSCLYRKDINIWDTMAVQVKYHSDIPLNYSLNACMPYEGYLVGFNGTKGRLDAREYHKQPWEVEGMADFRITKNFGTTKTFTIPHGGAGHWGSDTKMQDMIFRGAPDPLGQTAGTRAGALSILIGVAARRSIERQENIVIDELVKL